MKKLKLKAVYLLVEVDEYIENETTLSLDEDITISHGTFLDLGDNHTIMQHNVLQTNVYGQPINEYLYEKIDSDSLGTKCISFENVKSRKPYEKELEILTDYFKEEVIKQYDFIVYEITENNKIVVILNCSINSYENGEKSVMCNTSKVAIRHDIVYEIKENEFFLDYDEDISEITDLI